MWIHLALIAGLLLLAGTAAYFAYRVFAMIAEHRDKTADQMPPEFRVQMHFFRISMILFLFLGIVAMMVW